MGSALSVYGVYELVGHPLQGTEGDRRGPLRALATRTSGLAATGSLATNASSARVPAATISGFDRPTRLTTRSGVPRISHLREIARSTTTLGVLAKAKDGGAWAQPQTLSNGSHQGPGLARQRDITNTGRRCRANHGNLTECLRRVGPPSGGTRSPTSRHDGPPALPRRKRSRHWHSHRPGLGGPCRPGERADRARCSSRDGVQAGASTEVQEVEVPTADLESVGSPAGYQALCSSSTSLPSRTEARSRWPMSEEVGARTAPLATGPSR